MAAKIRMLKLLHEIRGYAAISNRRPKPRSHGLVLSQMRPPVIQAVLPRRKLNITMDKGGRPDLPHPVKINHLKQDTALAPTLPAS